MLRPLRKVNFTKLLFCNSLCSLTTIQQGSRSGLNTYKFYFANSVSSSSLSLGFEGRGASMVNNFSLFIEYHKTGNPSDFIVFTDN